MDTRTWWRKGSDTWMHLMSISISNELVFSKDQTKKLWDIHGRKFKLLHVDVSADSDSIEEQLWAENQGLA